MVRPDGRYPFVSIGWAGLMGVVTGVNSRGIFVALDPARTDDPIEDGAPLPIALRRVLEEADTLEHAVEILRGAELRTSGIVLVADGPQRKAVVVELGARDREDRRVVRGEDETAVWATDHLLREPFESDLQNDWVRRYSSSGYRYDRLGELLGQGGEVDPARVVSILRDRARARSRRARARQSQRAREPAHRPGGGARCVGDGAVGVRGALGAGALQGLRRLAPARSRGRARGAARRSAPRSAPVQRGVPRLARGDRRDRPRARAARTAATPSARWSPPRSPTRSRPTSASSIACSATSRASSAIASRRSSTTAATSSWSPVAAASRTASRASSPSWAAEPGSPPACALRARRGTRARRVPGRRRAPG